MQRSRINTYHNIQYPLYYDGTTSHDYDMACFLLGNKSVTIQEMNAVYSQEDAENDNILSKLFIMTPQRALCVHLMR